MNYKPYKKINIPNIPHLSKYEIDSNGDIRTFDTVMNAYIAVEEKLQGYYLAVNLEVVPNISTRFLVHRLVAIMFLEIPKDLISDIKYIPKDGIPLLVNHLDGNKTNNYYENLEWCTNTQNINHTLNTGIHNNSMRIHYTDGKQNGSFRSVTDLAKFLNVSHSRAAQIADKGFSNAHGDNLRFWYDMPENFIVSPSTRETGIEFKDYVNNKITIVNTIAEAARKTHISKTAIASNLSNEREENLLGGFIFRKIKGIRPWPKFDKEVAKVKREQYFIKPDDKRGKGGTASAMDVMRVPSGFIKRFLSLSEVSEYTGINYQSLVKFKGKINSSSPLRVYEGFIWREVGDKRKWEDAIPVITNGPKVPIKTRNIVTGEIREFISINQAAITLKLNAMTINSRVLGKKKKQRFKNFDFKESSDVTPWRSYNVEEMQTINNEIQ